MHSGHHTVSDVTGQDAPVSFVMPVQMLHGSIRNKLFFYYLHSQCGLQTCSQFKWSWHIVNNTEFHVRIIFLRGKMWIFWEFPNVTWLFFFHIEGEIFKTSKVTAHEWNLWSSVSQAPQTELYYSTRNVKPPLHLSSSLLSPPSFHLSRPKPLLSTLTPSTPPLLTLRCCRGV